MEKDDGRKLSAHELKERLNADLKHEISSKVLVRTKAKLKEAASKYMGKLEQNPERVRSYFRDPRVAYAG